MTFICSDIIRSGLSHGFLLRLLIITSTAIYLFLFTQPVKGATLLVPRQHSTIQDAVRVAGPGDLILVSPGKYQLSFDSLTIINESLTIKSTSGPEQTILSGMGSRPIITIDGKSKVIIDGFTISARSPVGDNSALYGGGIYCAPGTAPAIINNIFTGNLSSFGGAIYCDTQSSPVISGNLLIKNRALISGGGIYSHKSSATIIGNRFQENTADNSGGAIATQRDASQITNNVIWKNRAHFGGGISCERAAAIIANNTIVGNQADYGGGVVIDKGSARLTNLILWQNKKQDLFLKQTTSQARPVHSNIQDGSFRGINGNISQDPVFKDLEKGDFHLLAQSPSIDSGAEDSFYKDVDNSRNDMGAYGGPDSSKLPNSAMKEKNE